MGCAVPITLLLGIVMDNSGTARIIGALTPQAVGFRVQALILDAGVQFVQNKRRGMLNETHQEPLVHRFVLNRKSGSGVRAVGFVDRP